MVLDTKHRFDTVEEEACDFKEAPNDIGSQCEEAVEEL